MATSSLYYRVYRGMLMKLKYEIKKQRAHFYNRIGIKNYSLSESPLKKTPRILLIAMCVPDCILTITQTVQEMIKGSKYSVDLLNVYKGIPHISPKIMSKYAGIIIHNTASYHVETLDLIADLLLKDYDGIKIIMKQDEHYRTCDIIEYIDRYKFDALFSIWDEKTANKIYKQGQKNSKLEIRQFLTGYVPEEYRSMNWCLENRAIDVGYRGSIQPVLFGRLAYEKHEIGDRFQVYAKECNLTYDISSEWNDRFTGRQWLEFLGTCKAVLGVESGSNIVDYTGEVYSIYHKYIRKNPQATEEELLDLLRPFENEIKYTAVSPRHFEAAACKTLQIMYEGDFQNIFLPHKHYFPLKRDYSNVDEAIDFILDERQRKEMVECAYEEIIQNEKYSFENFVKCLDSVLDLLLNM